MGLADQLLVAVGQMEVICGCMFSGKTTLLLARSTEANRLGLAVRVFKPAIDDRYDCGQIVTHARQAMPAIPVGDSGEILRLADRVEVVLIDEAQFFDLGLPDVCRALAQGGARVIVAGLDRDSWGQPFGPMPVLESLAQRLTRITALCARCGVPAEYTQRVAPVEGQTMIGGVGCYEPRCARCFEPPPAHLRR